MRKLIALLLAVVMVLGLVACSTNTPANTPADDTQTPAADNNDKNTETDEPADDTTDEPATTDEPTEPVENKIIYGSSTEISGDWGRALWTNNATDKLIRDLMDDCSTVVSNQGGEYVVNPTVAKSVEGVMNDDGTKTYTVTIQDGLVYNNGDPITAKDFVNLALLCCMPAAKDLAITSAVYQSYVGGQAAYDGETNVVSGIRLLDEMTYAFTISSDFVPYFYDITYAGATAAHMASWFGENVTVADDGEGCYFTTTDGSELDWDALKAAVEANRFNSDNRISAGPYNLVSFDKSALQATLEINPNYSGNFEGQKPSVETIVVVKAEEATWADAMKTGEFNFYDTITQGTDINTAMDMIDAGYAFDYCTFDRAGYGKIMFQCDFGPTQFVEVRQAVALLLDRNEFANTFCQGWGGVVNGPYGTALWQYKDSEEWLADNLSSYEYNPDAAKALLDEGGWNLNENGDPYESGIRYKEVTAEEAGDYVHNVTLSDGRILMPLIIEWSSSEGNSVSELISVMLANGAQTADAGMQINMNTMSFSELLNYIYRDATQGDQYAVPTYGMYNLATGFTPAYDMSYNWTDDPDMVAQGYNQNYLFDMGEGGLDELSMDMVYGVESGDNETYLNYWREYILRWNQLLPEIPLYSNVYITMYPTYLEGYEQDSFWDFSSAILYASIPSATK